MYNEIENGLSVLPDDSIFKQKMLEKQSNQPNHILNSLSNDNLFHGYLGKNLGRWMKIEADIGGNIITKIGQLIKVGTGFIVLKLNTNPVSSIICETGCIKFVTILYGGRIKE